MLGCSTSPPLYCPDGLDVPTILDLRDGYGEVDRSRLPGNVQQLHRNAVMATEVDILVPAAISYAITPDNSFDVRARVVDRQHSNQSSGYARPSPVQ